MTIANGNASMDIGYDTTSDQVINFLGSLPSGRVSIHTTQGDRPWESSYSTLKVSWSYNIEERNAEDQREMMGT